VRITHLPTGLVTSCQNERSQHQNKDRAMKMMAAKLLDLERKKREDEIAGITGEQQNVGFGSQIRSYVMQPYQMVKDLRTEHETAQIDAVLGGAVDQFMEAWLRWSRARSDGDT
jgi:peptide chain release factor 2